MGKIYIQYFGITQDYAGKASEVVEFEGSLINLIQNMFAQYPSLNSPNIKIALNNQILDLNDTHIKNIIINHYNTYELLFLPPFAGG